MTAVLLEREGELGLLVEAIRAAGQGAGRAVLIEGEAGIGKTALVAAARERGAQADMMVLSARGGELEREFAWAVVRQLFDEPVARAPAGDRSRLLDGAAALSRPALGIEATETTADASYATLHGLYWLTVNLAERRPVLLAVDDLHWADGPSLRFVAHLLPRLAELPILLLLASRPGAAEPGPAAELLARIAPEPALSALRPVALSQGASGGLVREGLADDVGDDVCVACHELSAGNPFLLRALIAELADEEPAPTAAHVRRMTPALVSASVLLRLARLPEGSLPLARAVATLGEPATLHLSALLAGLDADEASRCAGSLIRAGILTGGDTLAFVHPLVRSAVYGDLSGPERSRWHRRAARLLAEERAGPEGVCAHLVASLPGGEAWTVERLRDGAADAVQRGAPEIAAAYLRRALAEPPGDEHRADVLFELGRIEAARDPAAAIPHLSAALEAAGGAGRRPEIGLALADAQMLIGAFGAAVGVLDEGLAAGVGTGELRASLEASRLNAVRWDPETQPQRRERVADMERRDAAGERLDPRIHASLAMEAAATGADRDGAVRHARAALATIERSSTIGWATVPEPILTLVFADLPGEAATAADEWLALARRVAWPVGAALCSTAACLAALYVGAVSDAVAHARTALTEKEVQHAPVVVAFLVEALIERGEFERATADLAEHGLDGELPFVWAMSAVLHARGRLRAATGNHGAAVADLLATGERCAAWGVANPAMLPWRSAAAASLARLGERDRAVALADEEIELARGWGGPRAIGMALRTAGAVREGKNGIELLREAVSVLEASPAQLEHARALAELGSALRRAGSRAEAREHLRAGLDLAHRLGGARVAEQAREELRIAGARPRRDALRGRDALTSSELRVARLASQGASNREIAEALFVTVRTVEAHLTSSYAKLSIASRRELAGALEATTHSPERNPQ